MTKRKTTRRLGDIILILMLIIGLSLLVYPSFSDYWNSFHSTRAIQTYIEHVAHIDNANYYEILESARKYNSSLCDGQFHWFLTDEQEEIYNAELNVDENGQIGFISIDKISVQLPVYHGTRESVLQRNIGHVEWTSLPVGGEGTHAVLSGHRGLPSARLFTDLDKLVVGDEFVLSVLDETLTYRVDQIRVIDPTDLTELQIVPGKDYCTLMTCTPYGINTHRLLVRGHRVDNAVEAAQVRVIPDARQIETLYVVPFVGVPILLLLLVLMILTTGRHARRRDSYAEVSDWEREIERDTRERRRAAEEPSEPEGPLNE